MNEILKDASFIIAALIEIGLPVAIAIIIWKKYKISWAIFFLGMGLFIASLIRIPINDYFTGIVRLYFMGRRLMVFSLLIPSLTAGLFEEGVRALAFGVLIKRGSYEKSLMYGIGHGGGGESMLFVGFQVLISYMLYRFAPHLLPSSALSQYREMLWYIPLLGAFERILAIILHISLSLLVMHAFLRKKYYFIVVAILFHTLFNFIGVYIMRTRGIIFSEITLLVFMLIALGATILIIKIDKKLKR